ncbi:butyrophilin subfamily 1 member A1-like isoform 3-T5 [Salvelinus alpinus]
MPPCVIEKDSSRALYTVMWLCILAAWCVSLSTATSDIFTCSVPEDPVSARLGHVATMPCWLTPSTNAEGLEVRWYRPKDFDNPVLLYSERKIQEASQQSQYVGRTSLGLREVTSEGLKGGDVTLKLVNVTLRDQGEYVCYISSNQDYETASVFLNVTVMGTPPLLSAVRTDADSVNVSCVSHGWKPRPRLQWSDGRQTLKPEKLDYSSGAHGLVSVRSWVLSSPSSAPWVSCSLVLSEGEELEGRVDLWNLGSVPETSSGLQTAVIILALVLLLSVVFVGVLYKKRGNKSTHVPNGDIVDIETMRQAEDLVDIETIKTMRQAGVDVTLDPKTAPPYLTVGSNGKIVRDSLYNPCPPGEHAYILGTHGFTSGSNAYWEVGLGDQKVGVKESWWVGLASGSVKRQGDVPATPSNGFWFLSSDKEKGLRLNMNPNILLPANPRPQTVGVYLDYDQGVLSFINVKDNKHIVTVGAMFTGEVFPLFNPGKGDRAPMTISDVRHYKTEPGQVTVSETERHEETETDGDQAPMTILDVSHYKTEPVQVTVSEREGNVSPPAEEAETDGDQAPMTILDVSHYKTEPVPVSVSETERHEETETDGDQAPMTILDVSHYKTEPVKVTVSETERHEETETDGDQAPMKILDVSHYKTEPVSVSVSEREGNDAPPAEEAETDALLAFNQSRNHQTSESKDGL